MKNRLAIGLGGLNLSLVATAMLSTYAPPAFAQGQNVESVQKIGTCPRDWHEGGTRPGQSGIRGRCYPDSSSSPRIYLRASTSERCATGYYDWDRYCTTDKPVLVSAERTFALATKLAKPAPNARCPVGWASTRDLQQCYTTIENGSVARLSNGKPCKSDELEEWGLWCTSNYQNIAFERADNAGAKDFNEVYAWTLRNRGDTKSVGDSLSPAATAWFASQKGGSSNGAASTSNVAASSSNSAGNAANQACANSAAAGAAVGGLLGGTGGARIGGMLGGLSKKKPGC